MCCTPGCMGWYSWWRLCVRVCCRIWRWRSRSPRLASAGCRTGGWHDDVIKWKHFPRYWPFTGEFPAQRPVTRSFDVFFDLLLNKRLSKQSWGWWFETLSRSLWRHRNEVYISRWECPHCRSGRCIVRATAWSSYPTVDLKASPWKIIGVMTMPTRVVLYRGQLGVNVVGGYQSRGKSCLDFCP